MTVFYSWQSNIKSLKNKIGQSIDKAVRTLGRQLEVDLVTDRDTKGLTGAVEIADSILTKISQSRVFIADITIIDGGLFSRLFGLEVTPNPNVLLELGYAVRKLGWENVVLICDDRYGKIEQLPFDLRHRRVLPFSTDKKAFESSLKGAIELALSSGEGVSRVDRDLADEHDIAVFKNLTNNVPEKQLRPMLDHIWGTCTYSKEETDFLFTKLEEISHPQNRFLDSLLNDAAQGFGTACQAFAKFLALNFFHYQEDNDDLLEMNKYRRLSDDEADRLTEEKREEMSKLIDILLKSYETFRITVKSRLIF